VPRHRRRICLQHGLKLDLNRLIRQGAARPGSSTNPYVIQWTRNGALIGLAVITANLCDPETGWLRCQTKGSDQLITGLLPSTLWRQAVVLRLPGHQQTSVRALDASRSERIPLPAGVGREGRI